MTSPGSKTYPPNRSPIGLAGRARSRQLQRFKCRHLERRGGRRSERGAGTLLGLWVAMVLLTAGVVAVLWAAVSIGTHRAAAAADLVALSAAQALQAGEPDPCRTAQRIAATQHVDLRTCQLQGETVAVEVRIVLRLGVLGSPSINTPARAGPIDDEGAN
ncbi:secretion/DNA translocation related TadE-like protein [Kribbella voronezhensis]|uniref:Secretion/DNA translocation related TadE-like protein n=1 Tax=Kribbella voronezhensis TaxID=2512212 RepID=A0A4R7TB71_9ACTN|nr:Rv3654c family TadE-like protein [Kribbella voronezhensis]TDU89290.1 secretion/DNA translocation related TadE-like protein [Kribbella voronezhensis]